MAKFDESKVINALHTDRAEIGKKYYCSDDIFKLKECVESEKSDALLKLISVNDVYAPFKTGCICWQLIYPYEEPPKKRMTYRQLAEWLARGNGERSDVEMTGAYNTICYIKGDECVEVDEDEIIRPWGSDEWVEPTVDIYERDCK